MQKPSNMSDEAFQKHRAAAQAEQKRRDAVEKNPTDAILALQDEVAALKAGKPAAAPKGKKK